MITLGKKKNKAKSFGLSLGKKLYPVAKSLAAPVAFLEQISAKHRQTMGSSFSQAPTTQKLKILANIVTGSISGVNFFTHEFQAQQTLNPAGVLNKWTNAGALMIAYGFIAKNVNKAIAIDALPAGGKVKGIGKQILIGGAVGGFFDDPILSQSSTRGTAHLSPQPQAMLTHSMSSGDSVSSGMN